MGVTKEKSKPRYRALPTLSNNTGRNLELNSTEFTYSDVSNDMIYAAYGNDRKFSKPTCTCLGFLGATLGGGIARDMNLYGQGLDQILSVNLVLASDQQVFIDPTHNPDLWFGVRATAPNFGIVSSAIVKAYPRSQTENVAWKGRLTFSDDKIPVLIQAIHDLDHTSNMEIDLLFPTSGPPAYKPMITAIPFLLAILPQLRKRLHQF